MKKTIVFILLMIPFLTVLSFSASAGTVADFLVEVGRMSYEKGNIADAVHEFNTALILQPNHQEAIRYLTHIQQHPDAFEPLPDMTARVEELSREVDLYQKILDEVESQRDDISEQLQQLTMAHESVLNDNRVKDEQLKQVQKRVEEMGVNLAALQKTPKSRMAEVGSGIKQPPAPVPSMAVHDVSRLMDSSLDVFERAQLDKKIVETVDLAIQQNDQVLALSRENMELKKVSETQKAAQQNIMELMDDYLYLHQARMNDVATQAVIAQVDLAEQHRALLDKTDALNQSNQLLEAVSNKMDERDSMIQQKNLQIDDLQKRLEWYQKNFEAPVNSQS